MFKWFWTIFSLGAPDRSPIKKKSPKRTSNCRRQRWATAAIPRVCHVDSRGKCFCFRANTWYRTENPRADFQFCCSILARRLFQNYLLTWFLMWRNMSCKMSCDRIYLPSLFFTLISFCYRDATFSTLISF